VFFDLSGLPAIAANMRRKAQVDSWLTSVKTNAAKPYLMLPERKSVGDLPKLRKLEPEETYENLQNQQNAALNDGVLQAARAAMLVNHRLGGPDPNAGAAPVVAAPAPVQAAATVAALPVSGALMSGALPVGVGVPMQADGAQQFVPGYQDGMVVTQQDAAYYNRPQEMMVGAGGVPPAGPRPSASSTKHCIHPGCVKGAIGKLRLCIAHGGGKRCSEEGCNKAAQGQMPLCKMHGGGRRCKHPGCLRSARDRTDLCIGHGGGKRCIYNGCQTSARSGTIYCSLHDGVVKKHTTGVPYGVPGMMPPGGQMMPGGVYQAM